MNIIVYSKEHCPACIKAKSLLSIKNMEYTETVIGKDILREEFIELFPEQKTVPLIIIDGVKIGGYDDLYAHFAD